MRKLSDLKTIADESLKGLEAGDELWRRIQRKANRKPFYQKKSVWIPAVAVAALIAVFCFGGSRLMQWNPGQTGTAGEQAVMLSGRNLSVHISSDGQSQEEGLLVLNGAVYAYTGERVSAKQLGQSLGTVQEFTTVSAKQLGQSLGTVQEFTTTPSLSSSSCVSSMVNAGEELFQIKGANGLIAASSGGSYLVFQRTSRFGKIGISQLEASLCKPEQVKSITFGDSTLTGEQAVQAMQTLLSTSERISDTVRNTVPVTIRLKNGLSLFLSAGEDCVIGCGVWYCPDFFQCFP